ncbi:universal stress protein [Streptomyces sp. NBC_00576]|uniref:universal stress protein n=1 Tax=Streptomyces sp. NBC_00576 TaxID=2903665 RepID=UPI002E810798|nr:universal stress protein [Streptomyces sp. NBC_00576]WUB77661.1 universal stress protein [Streptomyces sp. NBC_00576]
MEPGLKTGVCGEHGGDPDSAAYPHAEGGTRTVRTGPAPALLEATCDAAVVVVSARRGPQRLGRQLGLVTHTLLNHSRCPVVVVPTGTV